MKQIQTGSLKILQRWLNSILLATVVLAGCAEKPSPFVYVEFEDLPDYTESLTQQQKSYMQTVCKKWQNRKHISISVYGSLSSWKEACSSWMSCENENGTNCLQASFMPVELNAEQPLFTGYYAPIFKGSLKPTEIFNTPLYSKPKDIVFANLGLFDKDLKGKRLVGRIQGQSFIPYADRAEIAQHGVKAKPLVWMTEEDAFFMHIQGSGSIELADGQQIHVAYGGNNGLKYHAIGRTLVHKKHMDRSDVSMDNIRAWLESADYVEKQAVLNSNPRYIFFRKGDGVVRGSFGTALHDELSLAVDPSYVPLGAPVWVNTGETLSNNTINKLMFATDTGGAIEGAVRGDIYFGKGDSAGEKAGVQNESGRLFILIPRK